MSRRNIRRNIKIGTLSDYPINRIGDNAEERIEEAKHGGKIILPPSALSKVAHSEHRLMVFKFVQNRINAKNLVESHFFLSD